MMVVKLQINKNIESEFRFTALRFYSFSSCIMGGTLMDCHESRLLEQICIRFKIIIAQKK